MIVSNYFNKLLEAVSAVLNCCCLLFVLKLYIDTIRETLEEEDKSRPFLSSSPSNGVDTEREGWIAKKPSSPYWGDGKYFSTKLWLL